MNLLKTTNFKSTQQNHQWNLKFFWILIFQKEKQIIIKKNIEVAGNQHQQHQQKIKIIFKPIEEPK